MHKDEIRKRMRDQRRALSESWIEDRSRRVADVIESWDRYRRSHAVMYYIAFGNEVGTLPMIERALASGKTVAAPRIRVVGRRLTPRVITCLPGDLEPGAFGISAPREDTPELDPATLDMVLVPGLAFDLTGHRVGFGGGYYDRFLGLLPAGCVTVGVTYSFQIVDRLPRENHDLSVQFLATEDGIVTCGG